MNERVHRLTEEARLLTPGERAELLDALTAMVGEDRDEIGVIADWDEIGDESLGYLPGRSK